MTKHKMALIVAVTCMLLTACSAKKPSDIVKEETFTIEDYTSYVETRFGVTEEIYKMDNISDLSNILTNYMNNNVKTAIPEEIVELSYHLFNTYPNYISNYEDNILNKIVVEYIVTYTNGHIGEYPFDKLNLATKKLNVLYNHYFLGSDRSTDDIKELTQEINDIYTELIEEGVYSERSIQNNDTN